MLASALPVNQPLHRQALPDALRALAMLAVLMVNAAGYLVAPWGALLGERSPVDSTAALLVQGLIAAVLQGKGYPMLAYLFGMGLALAQRGRPGVLAHHRALTRQKRLLLLGVLHGVWVYFGDILTMYALIGWQLLRHLREPWPAFRRRLRRAVVWALAATLASIVLMVALAVALPSGSDAWATNEPTLAQAQTLTDFWLLNASAYAMLQAAALLLLWPVLRLCMLCGVAAARLRLLTHPRWRRLLGRWTTRWALPLVLLNLIYGLGYVSVDQQSQRAIWVELLGSLVGLPLAAVYVMALAQVARAGQAAWCTFLAPLGRCTLSLYVGHSLLCIALFTGLGPGWAPGTLAMALFSTSLWVLALLAARATVGRRWPLETWLARR